MTDGSSQGDGRGLSWAKVSASVTTADWSAQPPK